MNDELTRWADSARDYKAKLDWATTALNDILELASGNKCDPDYTAIDGLIARTVEAVRALKAELEQVHKAAAEMRDALGMSSPWTVIDTLHTLANWCDHLGQVHDCDCNGHEVRSEGVKIARAMIERLHHALSTDFGKVTMTFDAFCDGCGETFALPSPAVNSTSCPGCRRMGTMHPSLRVQVDRLRDELTRLRDIVGEADVALIDAALEETK